MQQEDIPIGDLHRPSLPTDRSRGTYAFRSTVSVGRSVSEGFLCKTLWVPIKAIRLESRDLYSIIPYAPGAEQTITRKTKTQ